MQWHALTLDGLMWDPLAETILSFRTGNMALGVTVDRLHRRLSEVLASARGRWPIGLKAAIVAQLNLSAWDSWTSYREVERLTGQPFPTMTPSGIAALCSGKLLPKPTPGVDGDGFLLS